MKIDILELKNVLSHEDTKFELGQYLTILTGKSDSGKSVGVRSLDQALRNEPAGIDLLRHGVKRGACSEVAVIGTCAADKPLRIVRRRGKSRNEYEVDGKPILAFGKGAPAEVRDRLRLSEHAFQVQSDGNFMLCEKAGTVAAMLSKTVGLEQIDAAFAEVSKRKTANDTELRCSAADLEREEAALARFAGLEEAAMLEEAWEHEAAALDAALADIDSARAILSAAAAIPGDASALHREACAAHGAAVKAEALASEGAAVMDAAVGLRDRLCAIPGDASTLGRDAVCAMETYVGMQAVASAMSAVSAEISALAEALSAVRRPAPVGLAVSAVRAWSDVADRRAAAEAQAESAMSILAELNRLPGDAAEVVAAATIAVAEWCVISGKLESGKEAYDAVAELLAELDVQEREVREWSVKVEETLAEIERYKAEHATCPECGASQEHWKTA